MALPETISEAGQLICQGEPVAEIDCTIKITYGPPHSWAGDFVIKQSPYSIPKLLNLLKETPDFSLELPSCKGKILISEQNFAKIEGEFGHGIIFQGTDDLVEKDE